MLSHISVLMCVCVGNVKQYNVSSKNTNDNQDNKMVPPVILYTDHQNGARLSKYNFLSQAFSQMRNSYAVHANSSTNELKMSPVSSASQPHPMYHEEERITNSPLPPLPPPSARYSPTRESTVTVGTLHAPLFQRNRTPQQYTSQLNVSPTMRSPVSSDVSEYPMSPSSDHSYPYF